MADGQASPSWELRGNCNTRFHIHLIKEGHLETAGLPSRLVGPTFSSRDGLQLCGSASTRPRSYHAATNPCCPLAGTTTGLPAAAARKVPCQLQPPPPPQQQQQQQQQQAAAIPNPPLNQAPNPQPPPPASSSCTHPDSATELLPLPPCTPTQRAIVPPSDLLLLPTSPAAPPGSCHDLPLLPGECCLGDSPAEPAAEATPEPFQYSSLVSQHTADTRCPDQSTSCGGETTHIPTTAPRLVAAGTHSRTARHHLHESGGNGAAVVVAASASSPASCSSRSTTHRGRAEAACDDGGHVLGVQQYLSRVCPEVDLPGARGQHRATGSESAAGEAASFEPVEEFRCAKPRHMRQRVLAAHVRPSIREVVRVQPVAVSMCPQAECGACPPHRQQSSIQIAIIMFVVLWCTAAATYAIYFAPRPDGMVICSGRAEGQHASRPLVASVRALLQREIGSS
jgi:hypothetical protein